MVRKIIKLSPKIKVKTILITKPIKISPKSQKTKMKKILKSHVKI